MRIDKNPDIILMGHPLLFEQQPEVPVDSIPNGDFQHNLSILKSAQEDSQGIGIAAPQIGWKARVMTVGISTENQYRYPQAPKIPFEYWINPEIVASGSDTCWTWEGCLSVPGMRAWVERPESVEIRGYNEQGQMIEKKLDGFHARVFQHEMDHLDGILFPMRVSQVAHIIPNEAIANQGSWAAGWPTPNARKTLRGQLSAEQ